VYTLSYATSRIERKIGIAVRILNWVVRVESLNHRLGKGYKISSGKGITSYSGGIGIACCITG
jgi:hypothetical protein